jgi:hypothetical protein
MVSGQRNLVLLNRMSAEAYRHGVFERRADAPPNPEVCSGLGGK